MQEERSAVELCSFKNYVKEMRKPTGSGLVNKNQFYEILSFAEPSIVEKDPIKVFLQYNLPLPSIHPLLFLHTNDGWDPTNLACLVFSQFNWPRRFWQGNSIHSKANVYRQQSV